MTQIAPGVYRRSNGELRAPVYRKRPEPQGPFAEECADAAAAQAADWKKIALRVRAR